jgi:hypothetical protein
MPSSGNQLTVKSKLKKELLKELIPLEPHPLPPLSMAGFFILLNFKPAGNNDKCTL